jgi:hypothetical protein
LERPPGFLSLRVTGRAGCFLSDQTSLVIVITKDRNPRIHFRCSTVRRSLGADSSKGYTIGLYIQQSRRIALLFQVGGRPCLAA